MKELLILFLFLCQSCFGFDLDDETYEKMPPLFALDDYDRCLLYNGIYCVIRTNLFAEPENELMSLMQNYTKSSSIKHYNHTYQNKGICLSTACKGFIGGKDLNSRSDLQEILDLCENKTIYEKYGLQAKVADDFYCDTKETRVDTKDILDWIVLAVFAFIFLLNVFATIYDLSLDEESNNVLSIGEKMMLCFSIRRNWNYLIAPPSSNPKVGNFQGINCLRALASFGMILGHVVWIFTMGFIDNPHDFERSYEVPYYQVIYNGMVVVQIFFVFSGFLLIYNLEDAAEEKRLTWKVIPVIALHRFLRLAPPLALMVAFNATWVRFLGSGPLWKRYVASMVDHCRQYWWTHILFINNYFTKNVYCTVQTWHTAADTQVFFVGIVVYLLTRRKHLPLVAALFMAIGMLIPALHVYFQDLNAQFLKTPEMLRTLDDPNRYPYVFAHNNIPCFLLGMVVAYKLHQWQKQGVVFKGTIARLLFNFFIIPVLLMFFGGNLFHEEDYRTPMWIRMLWQGTHRLFLGIPIAIPIVGMAMVEENSLIYRFMRWSGFRVAGKLTYSVFLIHETFTHLVAGSKTNLEHFSYFSLIIHQLGIVFLTYLLAVPFHLMLEAPVIPLLKLILTRSKSTNKSTMIPDPNKNFIADIIKAKRKRAEKKDNANEIREENTKGIGTQMDENTKNELLEECAKECSDVKMKTS